MQSQPSVTACLTAYNAETFIGPVLESLAEQTWSNLRILVSDDCSDDSTSELISRFAGHSSANIELFRQGIRLGWVDNTNFLLDRVESDYFFLCYHDDIEAPAYVKTMMEAILANQQAIGAFSDISMTKPDGEQVIRAYDVNSGLEDALARGLNIISMKGYPWVANRGVFRSSILKTVGGLRKNLAGEFSAAFPWVLGLALEGQLQRVPEILVQKTLCAEGVSTRWKRTYREFLAMFLDMYQTIYLSTLEEDVKNRLMLAVAEVCEDIVRNRRLNAPYDLSHHLLQ